MNKKSLILCGIVTSTYAMTDIFYKFITFSSTGKPLLATAYFFLYNLIILGAGAYSWWQLFKISFATK